MSSVDVIVPCYNYGHLVEACVRSVLSQQQVDVRVLLMDDASTDDTESVGRRLAADPRVEYRRHAVNIGHIHSYNEALACLTADYCLILSADDLLTPGALVRAARLMDAHPEVGLTYGRDITFRHTPPVGVARANKYCAHRIMNYAEFLERSCLLGHTPIQSPTAVARTALHREIGEYLPELPHSGDTEIWLRMAAHAKVCELSADQAFRRLHAHNMSLDYPPLRRLEEQKKAFDIHFNAYRSRRPEIASFEPLLNRTIAEAAFWSGSRAFDGGDTRECDAFLSFASAVWPDIGSSAPWRRLRWKRRMGRGAYRWLAPVAARVRQVASGRPKREAENPPGVGTK